jgi:lysozyme
VTDSAQGIDVSAYQAPLTAADLAGLDFAFAKATDGPDGTDPNFAANWDAIRAAGKFRGAYHELRASDVAAQAARFLATVRAAGLEAGDMLAVSVSDYAGVTDADAKAWLDAVKAATEGRNPVICYSDLSVAAGLGSCTGYDLWVARPSDTAPASVAPWPGWRLWQWNETGLDRNAFNGTADEMATWVATYAKPAPPSAESWEDHLVATIPVIKKGSANEQAVKNWQSLLVARGYSLGTTGERGDGIDGTFGDATDQATRDFQSAKGVEGGPDGVVGEHTWTAGLAT